MVQDKPEDHPSAIDNVDAYNSLIFSLEEGLIS